MYQAAAYLHLLAMAVWVGGILFIAIVLVPITRRMQEPPGSGSRVLGSVGRRFRPVSWTALVVLVVTGAWLLAQRGVGPGDILTGDGVFYEALRTKLGFVALLLVLSILHDFVLGPRLARQMQESSMGKGHAVAVRRRKLVSWLARVNLLITLVIVAMGVLLVRGSPV